jgi:hypothetical protein
VYKVLKVPYSELLYKVIFLVVLDTAPSAVAEVSTIGISSGSKRKISCCWHNYYY